MNKKYLIMIVSIYIVIRIYIASLSSYGFYHGWNEGWYSLIAKNYFYGSFWEQIPYTGQKPIFNVPPMFSYVVYVFFNIFGTSDISARLVSIFSEIIGVVGIYILAKELYDEKIAGLSVIIFILIPWNILWFGRVQTDPLMTAMMILAIALYVKAYRDNKSMLPFGLTLGFAIFTKQPALAVLPIIFIWSYFQGIKKKQIINSIISTFLGMIPLFIWLLYHAFSANYNAISNLTVIELLNRTEAFSDLYRVILFTVAWTSPLVVLAAIYQIIKERDIKNILVIWLLIYGTFVLIRTPLRHEYYSLPLMAPIAILASSGITGILQKLNGRYMIILFIVFLISSITITYVLFNYTGDSGYTSTEDVGIFLNNYMNKNPDNDYLVIVQSRYGPQIAWYSNLTFSGKRQINDSEDKISVEYVERILNNSNKQSVFLVTDDHSEWDAKTKYEKIFESKYEKNRMLDIGFRENFGLTVLKY